MAQHRQGWAWKRKGIIYKYIYIYIHIYIYIYGSVRLIGLSVKGASTDGKKSTIKSTRNDKTHLLAKGGVQPGSFQCRHRLTTTWLSQPANFFFTRLTDTFWGQSVVNYSENTKSRTEITDTTNPNPVSLKWGLGPNRVVWDLTLDFGSGPCATGWFGTFFCWFYGHLCINETLPYVAQVYPPIGSHSYNR